MKKKAAAKPKVVLSESDEEDFDFDGGMVQDQENLAPVNAQKKKSPVRVCVQFVTFRPCDA